MGFIVSKNGGLEVYILGIERIELDLQYLRMAIWNCIYLELNGLNGIYSILEWRSGIVYTWN